MASKSYKHGIAKGDFVRILRGRHKNKLTTADEVSSREISTPLGKFKLSQIHKYTDHRPALQAAGWVQRAKAKVIGLWLGEYFPGRIGQEVEVKYPMADGTVLVFHPNWNNPTAYRPEQLELFRCDLKASGENEFSFATTSETPFLKTSPATSLAISSTTTQI